MGCYTHGNETEALICLCLQRSLKSCFINLKTYILSNSRLAKFSGWRKSCECELVSGRFDRNCLNFKITAVVTFENLKFTLIHCIVVSRANCCFCHLRSINCHLRVWVDSSTFLCLVRNFQIGRRTINHLVAFFSNSGSAQCPTPELISAQTRAYALL